MRSLINIMLFAYASFSSAQTFSTQSQTHGILKTKGHKYEGILDVSIATDQAMWHRENLTRIFSAREIISIVLKTEDNLQTVYRSKELDGQFYLFEILGKGKDVILVKEGIIKDKLTKTVYPSFFRLDQKKKIRPIESKKELLSVFGTNIKWMSQYIRNQKLDLTKKSDIQQALDYYGNSYEASSAQL